MRQCLSLFLFLLVSGIGCGLLSWHSLDYGRFLQPARNNNLDMCQRASTRLSPILTACPEQQHLHVSKRVQTIIAYIDSLFGTTTLICVKEGQKDYRLQHHLYVSKRVNKNIANIDSRLRTATLICFKEGQQKSEKRFFGNRASKI